MAGADGNAETVSPQWVTSGIFDVLGVKPIAGRTFSADDEATRANAVVLSESLWRTRFNSDPGLIGRELRLDGSMFTVFATLDLPIVAGRAFERSDKRGSYRQCPDTGSGRCCSAIVTAVLVVTAGTAIAGPAWRATRIDPASALRSS